MPRFDVTIAGELNLDLILYGLPEQLPPERELLADRMALTLGSSSAIVAHNLAALGSSVGFQSRIGDDELGPIALDRLRHAGVDVSRVRVVPGTAKTGLTVILPRTGWRNILTYSGTISEFCWDDLDLDYLADSRHFHLSSYYLQSGLRPRVGELLQRLKQSGLTISLDTNDDPSGAWDPSIDEALAYVDILMPNEREACHLAHEPKFDLAARRLSELAPLVVVKRGAQGAVAFTESTTYSAPARVVTAVDAVGAGDSFNAGFLHAWLKGESIEECLAFGNLAGSYSATAVCGVAAFRNRPAMREFFAEHAQQLKE